MPFECRKDMTWGPGKHPVQLRGGDEVPAPIKLVLIQNGSVVKVDNVAGKPWADQSKEHQEAWAECNGQSILHVKDNVTGEEKQVRVKTYDTRMVTSEADAPTPQPRRRGIVRNTIEAPEPAPSESLEVAGGEVLHGADEPVPPRDVDKPTRGASKKKKRRGKPPRK